MKARRSASGMQRYRCDNAECASNTVLAYVFGKRTDDVFKNARHCLPPLDLFMPFGYTDDWGAYSRHLNVDQHEIGKRHTQKIERKKLEPENLDQATDT